MWSVIWEALGVDAKPPNSTSASSTRSSSPSSTSSSSPSLAGNAPSNSASAVSVESKSAARVSSHPPSAVSTSSSSSSSPPSSSGPGLVSSSLSSSSSSSLSLSSVQLNDAIPPPKRPNATATLTKTATTSTNVSDSNVSSSTPALPSSSSSSSSSSSVAVPVPVPSSSVSSSTPSAASASANKPDAASSQDNKTNSNNKSDNNDTSASEDKNSSHHLGVSGPASAPTSSSSASSASSAVSLSPSDAANSAVSVTTGAASAPNTPASSSAASGSSLSSKLHNPAYDAELKEKVRYLPKPNSTSTIFATGTLASPDVDELMLSIAMVIQLQLMQDMNCTTKPHLKEFDDDVWYVRYFEKQRAKASESKEPPGPNEPMTEDEPIVKKSKTALPTLDYVTKYIKALTDFGGFSPECNIIALILLNRLLCYTGMPLLVKNWRPVFVTALLIAQKIWDDRSLGNSQFCKIVPLFTKAEVNQLETRFLELIRFDLSVSSKVYAQYYYELRSIAEEQDRLWKLKPLTKAQAQKLANQNFNRSRKKKTIRDKKVIKRRHSFDMYTKKNNAILG